jgi:serine/threonine protein kinase/tetratricopeptide (TPR) repeat protein
MMTPERWQQVKELLGTALELDPAKRPGYLDQACGNDATLRSDLERLLVAEQKAGPEFLSDPVILQELTLELPPHPHAWVGRRLGAYEIVEEIGTGGMGEVFRAVRADDEYRKEVAIKLVRSGQDSSFVLSRFKNERQILASLDHPNIARMLDGGTTEEGVPYFVMELIQGERINQYCDTLKLATTERLKLFLQVCSAVQYAHQHLVIHRDIKPGNILVTAEGVPKLLDFGIAKILESSDAADQREQTMSLIRLLTPEYASPEQVKGEQITTTSDVYSLGVVLYELLTGRTPYHVPTRTPHEISRAVCEAEPEKPSTAVRRKQLPAGSCESKGTDDSALSSVREGSPEKLNKRLTGDLDNIVLMALRKEPHRRYATVEQFAEDIRRHLDHLPVLARKDTFGYRTSKFVTRHKAGVAAGVVVAFALIAGMLVTLREARIARANELRAERRFNEVRALANSLMFEVHDSIRDLPGATAARKLIIQRAQEYLDSLAQESKSDPKLLRELAAAYARLASVQGNARDANEGETSKAVQNYRKAAVVLETDTLLEPASREARLELAQTYMNLGMSLSRVGDKDGYRENTQRAIGILEPLAASKQDDQKTQALLGEAYAHAGFASRVDPSQALNYHEKALAVFQRLAKLDPKNELYQTQLSFSHKRVGAFLTEQNQLSAALEHERAALEIDEAQLALHPDSVKTRYNITFAYNDTGDILDLQGDFDGALRSYQKALEIRTALVQADPQDTKAKEGLARTHNYIGWNRRQKGDLAAALVSYRKGLALREMLSEKNPANEQLRFEVAQSQSNIGDVYAAMALRPGVTAKDDLTYCRESETWNRRALPMWLQMKAQGKLLPSDEERLTKINQNLEKCGRITAPVSQTRSPAMPVRPN